MPSDDEYKYLNYADNGPVHTIQLDHPPLNLLTENLKKELLASVRAFHDDPTARVLLLRGGEGSVFSAGRNLNQSRSWIESETTAQAVDAAWVRGRELVDELLNSSKPSIAVVEGPAIGGGAELLLPCDFVVASRTADIGFPEIKRGLFPGTGGAELLQRHVGSKKALELLLLGDTRPSSEWSDLGLVSRVCDPAETFEEASQLGEELAERPQNAVAAIKEILGTYSAQNREAGRRIEREKFAEVFTSAAAAEGVSAFFDDREPDFSDLE